MEFGFLFHVLKLGELISESKERDIFLNDFKRLLINSGKIYHLLGKRSDSLSFPHQCVLTYIQIQVVHSLLNIPHTHICLQVHLVK